MFKSIHNLTVYTISVFFSTLKRLKFSFSKLHVQTTTVYYKNITKQFEVL